MLKISKDNDAPSSFTPNLLPCKIHQDGPIDAPPRYWSPKTGEDGKPEVYFRGRKLKGREIKIPEGYRGVIVKANGTEKEVSTTLEIGDADDEREEVRVLEEVGSFDGVMAWGHESLVEDDDAFVKGVAEWVDFSQAMHKPGDEGKDKKTQSFYTPARQQRG